ncbi:MAG TPA: hypothetical protein VMW00_02145 [Dehalococcoidales bacterium]|nr:hypothetical protein [Dehalococcoidales bacterium]
MFRSKKLIVGVVLAVVLLAGSIGGIALANGGDDNSPPEARNGALLDKVCEIYKEKTGVTIDPGELEDAFAQAQSDMRNEALDNYLNGLVSQGTITQEQAGQYKTWLESKPDVPLEFGFRGHGGFRGIGGMPGFGGPCHPAE